MSKIIVLGAGIIGLATATLLVKNGHEVTVVERDDAPRPGSPHDAWQSWERRGVAQFRQPHYLHSGGRVLLDQHLPEVTQTLRDAGCITFDMLGLLPPSITDRARQPGDERFVTVTGRRTTLEYAFARAAERGGVRVIRGLSIAGLLPAEEPADETANAARIPHITGVRTTSGGQITADLVIDATGRGSKLPDWLENVGARRPTEDSEESGFFYYTRFFRSASGQLPPFKAGLLTHFHSFSLLTLPGDDGTWSVTVFFFVGDAALKALKDADKWTALVKSCPTHAQWLDGEPISDVLPMGGITDRCRRFVVDGSPIATGVLAVGDALACTNPVGGRGMTMGLMHAIGTAEVINDHLHDPEQLAFAHDRMTELRLAPWYRSTVGVDRIRMAQINAAIQKRPAPPPSGPGDALQVAMMYDPVLFRAYLEIVSLLALPHEVLSRPGLVDRIMELADTHPPIQPPSPTRAELLRMLA